MRPKHEAIRPMTALAAATLTLLVLSPMAAAAEMAPVEAPASAPAVDPELERVLAATELPQERRDRWYDLRPLIERLWLERCPESVEGRVVGGEVVLGMQLAARAGATARPEAVLDVLGMGEAFARYHRQRLLRAAG